MINLKYAYILLITLFLGCKYSFTGVDIPSDVKTFSVAYFSNISALAPPQLSQEFTEALRDIFQSQTRLSSVQNDGDLKFTGNIVGYEVTPVGVQGNEIAAKNRLTITVRVTFENKLDAKKNYENYDFRRFYDFDNNQNITIVQNQLIKEINAQLVQDIFNKSVGNW